MASADSLPTPTGRRAWRSFGLALAALGVVSAAAIGGWLLWPRQPFPVSISQTASPPPDPRLTFPTRYRNVHPDVAYVGAERCTSCHREIANQYHQHPMGQSMAAFAETKDWTRIAPKPWQAFDAAGLHYRIEQKNGGLWHIESKIDARGKEV